MAVVISHRFSTVRMVDRIAVIEAGRISEQGGHQELLSRGGTYAQLFSLQAEGIVSLNPFRRLNVEVAKSVFLFLW